MEITATIDFNYADPNGMGGGELTITNWDEQVKIEGAGPSAPIYLDRADLIRLLCALQVAA